MEIKALQEGRQVLVESAEQRWKGAVVSQKRVGLRGCLEDFISRALIPRVNLSLSSLLMTGKHRNGSWNVCGGRGSVCKDPIASFSVQFRHFGFQSCWDTQWP